MNIPPITNPRAYATHLLVAWQAELLERQAPSKPGRPNALLALITVELARRKQATN
jgi:hypothetical protein